MRKTALIGAAFFVAYIIFNYQNEEYDPDYES